MRRLVLRPLPFLLFSLLLCPRVGADWSDDDDIRQTVLRIAYSEGDVSFSRGDDPDNWESAARNFPMTLGDRLYTGGDGRIELEGENGRIFVGPETDMTALSLSDDSKQLSLGLGVVSIRLSRLDRDEAFEVGTPAASVLLTGPGYYRVDVYEDGETRVTAWRGGARVAAGGGEVELETGDAMSIEPGDRPHYDVYAGRRLDSWDRWVERRTRRHRDSRYRENVAVWVPGLDDLDDYGTWDDVPEYGSAWFPSDVASDWMPYRAGRWVWQDPWGWTWIGDEAWGWAPYHYGRWVMHRNRWCWVPAGRAAGRQRYSPALVGFTGLDLNVRISLGHGGFVGWFPLGPRDPFLRWWGSRTSGDPAGVTFQNRRHVTVVQRETFIGGRIGPRAVVREKDVVGRFLTAPVVRGSLPVVPVPSSLRFSVSTTPAPRPRGSEVARTVVTRLAPPPVAVPFSVKTTVIRERGGEPVSAEVSRKLVVDSPPSRRVVSVRPDATDPGRVVLAPKGDAEPSKVVRPLTPSGRRVDDGAVRVPDVGTPRRDEPVRRRVEEPTPRTGEEIRRDRDDRPFVKPPSERPERVVEPDRPSRRVEPQPVKPVPDQPVKAAEPDRPVRRVEPQPVKREPQAKAEAPKVEKKKEEKKFEVKDDKKDEKKEKKKRD